MGFSLGLFVLASATSAPLSSPAAIVANSNGSDVCGAIQAAYSAALDSPTTVHPGTVVAPSHNLSSLADFLPAYRNRLPLKAEEFDELQAQQPRYAWTHFVPSCQWTSPEKNMIDGAFTMTTSFSYPIFSLARTFALIEVSFYHEASGHGEICVARKTGPKWTAQCEPGWIS